MINLFVMLVSLTRIDRFEEVFIVYYHYILFFNVFLSYSKVISSARKVKSSIYAIRQYIFKAEIFFFFLIRSWRQHLLHLFWMQPHLSLVFPFCVGSACSSRTVHRRLRRNKSSNRAAYIRRGSQRICSKIDIKGGGSVCCISQQNQVLDALT